MNAGLDPAADIFLLMAERDYVALRKMADDPGFADEIFGFHAQQAVEKAAKAVLASRNVVVDRTHDLETLFAALSDHGCIDASAFAGLLDLTDFAVQYRYQAFDDPDAGLDRKAIALLVRAFLDRATQLVRSDATGRQ